MTPNFSYLFCLLVYGLSLSQLLVFYINMRKVQPYNIYSLKSFQSKYYYRPSISKTTCFLILLSCGRLRWQQLNGSVEKIRKQAISAYILRAWLNVSYYVSYIWEESGPIHMYDLCYVYVCYNTVLCVCYVLFDNVVLWHLSVSQFYSVCIIISFSHSVSDAPPDEVKERKYEKFDATKYKTDAEKRDELVR